MHMEEYHNIVQLHGCVSILYLAYDMGLLYHTFREEVDAATNNEYRWGLNE